ncbi:MAG: sensor histidine kinase [Clostridia bacterium]|nr:sensor histidine kinase [Clostridia bacterium]
MREYLLFGYCISHFFMILLIYHFVRKRYSYIKTWLILFIEFLLLSGQEVCRYYFDSQVSMEVLFFILQVVIVQGTTLIISKNRDARALFTGLSASNYTMAGSVIGGMLYIWTDTLIIALLTATIIHALLLIAAIRYLKADYLTIQTLPSRSWIQLCVLPILFYLSIFTCASWPVTLFDNTNNCLPTLLFLTAIFVSYAFLLRLFHVKQNEAKITRENEVLLSYTKVLQHEQKHLEEIRKELSIQKHDFQYHLRILLSLCEEKGVNEVQTALIEMLHQTENARVPQEYCKNIPVNSVFSYFSQEAANNEIQMDLSLDIPDRLAVPELELAAAIANLLDNAVRACKEFISPSKRWLKINGRYVGNQIIIEIANPCMASKIMFDEVTGLPLSDRGESHGIGMQSVLAFTRRNGAEFDCEIKENVFYARLLI